MSTDLVDDHQNQEVLSCSNNKNENENENENGLCHECQKRPFIYQCPACKIRTCSLPCCVGHKKRTKCTGKRQRSEFMPLCRMNDDSLRSDYFFLEEVLTQLPRAGKVARMEHSQQSPAGIALSSSSAALAASAPKQQRPQQRHPNCQPPPPTTKTTTTSTNNNNKKIRRLVQQAQRRDITLQVLPSFMERHQSNTSWYCGPRDMITWRVECIFIIPSKVTLYFQISEEEENLWDYIKRQYQRQYQHHDTFSNGHDKRGIQHEDNNYKLFLKLWPCPANQPRYLELNGTKRCLRKALVGLTIIEYPTIFCVPNGTEHLKEFLTGTAAATTTTTTTPQWIVEETTNNS
jgi:hypothetical protein